MNRYNFYLSTSTVGSLNDLLHNLLTLTEPCIFVGCWKQRQGKEELPVLLATPLIPTLCNALPFVEPNICGLPWCDEAEALVML
jgi:hypothetical protein